VRNARRIVSRFISSEERWISIKPDEARFIAAGMPIALRLRDPAG